jgi:hypothetical protein
LKPLVFKKPFSFTTISFQRAIEKGVKYVRVAAKEFGPGRLVCTMLEEFIIPCF